MFTELTREEQYECNGGFGPVTLYGVVKALLWIGGAVFTLGALEGCAAEAAKDIEESETK